MQREVVFVYPIIRTDFIGKSLETLFQHTDPEKFRVIVVDQSIEGLDKKWTDFLYQTGHMYIRMGNQGFSKASNEGIIHALRWGAPYIAVVNDDTEFMYDGWFEDAISEFDTDPNIIAVCPESPRVPMWGYGLEHGINVDILPYKEEYTDKDISYLKSGQYNEIDIKERHNFEIPQSFPFNKSGVVDGIAMWLPIFKREGLIETGLFEEKFIWGGGEDYDYNARVYSCAWPVERDVCDPAFHRRMVSTMKSWVWHHWGQSKDVKKDLDPALFEEKEAWNENSQLWPQELNGGHPMDVWGHYEKDGVKTPFKRIPDVLVEFL